ncbi:MAG: META domain-containing protein [Gammaproteobacteria bacterium]|nr:META domain-containing protein [Gammaproteobacteria bacterium]
MKIRIACLALITLLHGCAADTAPTAAPPADAAANSAVNAADALFAPASWTLVELQGKAVPKAADAHRAPFISFSREGNRVSGFAGCNRFTGTFTVESGNRLKFSPLAMTRMMCADDALEPEFMKVLESHEHFQVEGQALVLSGAQQAPLARFAATAQQP